MNDMKHCDTPFLYTPYNRIFPTFAPYGLSKKGLTEILGVSEATLYEWFTELDLDKVINNKSKRAMDRLVSIAKSLKGLQFELVTKLIGQERYTVLGGLLMAESDLWWLNLNKENTRVLVASLAESKEPLTGYNLTSQEILSKVVDTHEAGTTYFLKRIEELETENAKLQAKSSLGWGGFELHNFCTECRNAHEAISSCDCVGKD